MATTGALIGLRVPGVEIDEIGTTAKTLPEFTAAVGAHARRRAPEPRPGSATA